MKYEYDSKTDILLIKLSGEKPDFAEERAGIITHYNKDGKPIELEILDASRAVLNIVEAVFKGKKAPAASASA